jgi:hypothetical protein
MVEYTELIQKEKQEALKEYKEDVFRSQLDQEIAKDSRPSRSFVLWFQRPAVAGSSVLLIAFLIWLSTQFFLPSSMGSKMLIKESLIRLFSQNRTILNQIPAPVEKGYEKSLIDEFEWSVKRVIYAVQRENAPDEDITRNFSRVLQNTSGLIKPEKDKPGEWNI